MLATDTLPRMSAAPPSSALQTSSVKTPWSPSSSDTCEERLALRIDRPSRSDACALSIAGTVPSHPLWQLSTMIATSVMCVARLASANTSVSETPSS
jgi:hypothetical protein